MGMVAGPPEAKEEPPVPGEESGLHRQESVHAIQSLATSVPGLIQTTYNNSYNTYYGTPAPTWDGYNYVDHNTYAYDYSTPPPGYGIYGEKVYADAGRDERG